MGRSATLGFALAALAVPAWAGVCETAWDGDKIVASIAGAPNVGVVPLRSKAGKVVEVGADQIEAFAEAKNRIAGLAHITPVFIICSDAAPNAFAAPTPKGDLVGVTIGMLKMVDGDRDMAAAVIGHEVAHHTKQHGVAAQQREQVLGVAAAVVGILLSAKAGRGAYVPPSSGMDLARIGGSLVTRKFDRDQEREADEVGFQYMLDAAFNPAGAVRLAERFAEKGADREGLFFDSHPGWGERVERFRKLIAESPKAQELVARGDTPRNLARLEARQALAAAATEPAFATSDAQKSYTEGMSALRERNLPVAVRELRASAAAGYAPAQVLVGSWNMNGFGGIARDEAEGLRLYRLAAEQDEPSAMNQLGILYFTGRAVVKDEVEALRYFRMAAERNFALGQRNVGIMYERGAGGLAKDDAEAVKWYRLAAEQGAATAQYQLARMYETGRGGLSVDIDEAAKLYRQAADAGYAPAAAAVKRLGR